MIGIVGLPHGNRANYSLKRFYSTTLFGQSQIKNGLIRLWGNVCRQQAQRVFHTLDVAAFVTV